MINKKCHALFTTKSKQTNSHHHNNNENMHVSAVYNKLIIIIMIVQWVKWKSTKKRLWRVDWPHDIGTKICVTKLYTGNWRLVAIDKKIIFRALVGVTWLFQVKWLSSMLLYVWFSGVSVITQLGYNDCFWTTFFVYDCSNKRLSFKTLAPTSLAGKEREGKRRKLVHLLIYLIYQWFNNWSLILSFNCVLTFVSDPS